jgi:UDP-4-amino-4,6-dideoxy-N-acetyl-beta-L-altrosamine N-acetyltransferase
MLNKEKIALDEHLKFIENLENSNKIYIKAGDLGVVNFTLENGYAEFGIHKNPEKKGAGKKLTEFGISYAFKELKISKIILYVFEDNIKAINLYKKYGFKQTDKKNNLIKMELSYENWKNRYK